MAYNNKPQQVKVLMAKYDKRSSITNQTTQPTKTFYKYR